MWLIACALAYAAAVAVSLYRAMRQLGHYRNLDLDPRPSADGLPSVAIVVPARNESATIESCLTGLLSQDYPSNRLLLFAVDDNSSDGTAPIIQHVAARDPRARLIQVTDLPGGWTGKNHACWHGAVAAETAGAEWLCFIDADTSSERGLLRSAIGFARRRGLDMLSLEPFQELTGFLDRLVIPVGFLAIAATQELRRPDTSDVTANGQFILIKTANYFAAGGHSAVRGAICEDSALARRIRGMGYSIAVVGGERLIRTRLYAGAADVWEGLSKNLTEIYGGSARTIAIIAAGFAVAWTSLWLPVLAATAAMNHPSPSHIATLILAALTSIAVYATQAALARHFRVPLWYGLLLPLACSVGIVIAGNAVIARGRGRVAWKGRFYASPERAAAEHEPSS